MPSGPAAQEDQNHLFIICTDANKGGEHLLVNVTSWRGDFCDGTCILEGGTHEFIRQKSYILYRKARIERAQTLANGAKDGLFIPKECLPAGDFERVCDGIAKSLHTPRKIRDFYENNK